MTPRLTRALPVAGVAILSLVSLAVRYQLLASDPEPPGTDGYYYVVQVEDLLSKGRLHAADSSWVLRALALPGLFLDPITAVKLGAALLATACVPAAFAVGWQLRDRALPPGVAAWVLAIWAASSPTRTTSTATIA